jgi:hypothetical protein
MAAIRCAGAGRMLLRRAPGLLRQAAIGGERGVLHRQPLRALAPSSNRYISNYYDHMVSTVPKPNYSGGASFVLVVLSVIVRGGLLTRRMRRRGWLLI